MLFDKLIWTSVSPVRKDSTYISLEYVLNDLGVFCKGEQRTKDVGFAMSRIGAPLGMTAVPGADYAAKSLGRIAILWSRITDVQEDSDKGVIVVFGNAHDKIVIKYEPEIKNDLLSRIDSMRQFCASSPSSDAAAAAWIAWAADQSISNPFAPLDTLVEEERLSIESRSYTESQLDASIVTAEAKLPEEAPAVCAVRVCLSCGKEAAPTANFCTGCGTKL